MDINFELYKIFYHAANLKSFSSAADNLFITQSAVSQAIKNLENQLNCQLFYRKSRKVVLTWEGEMLFKHIEQAYNSIKSAENKFLEIQNLSYGEIKLGASDTVCKYYLISYLEQFNKLYPKVKIKVINRTSPQILDMLKKQSLDIGIVTLPVDDKHINVVKFLEAENIFIACNKFSNIRGKTLSFNEIATYPLLMLERNSKTRQNLDDFFKKSGVSIIPEIELESVDLLVEFAKIGLGIACVLKESAAMEIQKKQLFKVKLKQKLPPHPLGICILKDVPISKAASKFIEILQI